MIEKKQLQQMKIVLMGGEGSGNFDHAGRPGKVGGSAKVGGGKAGWGDEHARKNAYTVPGKRKMPWEMSEKEYNSLIVVYRGTKSTSAKEGYAFFSNSPEIAKFHGKVRSYRVLQGSKIFPDPEVEGELDETLNGLQSLNNGSAVIHYDDVVPNFEYSTWKK